MKELKHFSWKECSFGLYRHIPTCSREVSKHCTTTKTARLRGLEEAPQTTKHSSKNGGNMKKSNIHNHSNQFTGVTQHIFSGVLLWDLPTLTDGYQTTASSLVLKLDSNMHRGYHITCFYAILNQSQFFLQTTKLFIIQQTNQPTNSYHLQR